MVEEIETNNMQFLYRLSSQHNAKAWLQNCSKSVEGGGGGGAGDAHSHCRGLGCDC